MNPHTIIERAHAYSIIERAHKRAIARRVTSSGEPSNPQLCTVCKKNPRMVSRTGKVLTMCESCQRDYWAMKKNPNAKTRRPIKERSS